LVWTDRQSAFASGLLIACGYAISVIAAFINDVAPLPLLIVASIVAIALAAAIVALGRYATRRLSVRASVALMSLAVAHVMMGGGDVVLKEVSWASVLSLLAYVGGLIVAIDAVRLSLATQVALKEGREPPTGIERSAFERKVLWKRWFWGAVALSGILVAAAVLLLSHPGVSPADAPLSAGAQAEAARETSAAPEAAVFDVLRVGARFEDYPAAYYTGPAASPDLSGKAGRWRVYESTLRNAASDPPNFAGHYRGLDTSCGGDCSLFLLIDLETGKVDGLSGDDVQARRLFRAESKLLKVVAPMDDDGGEPACMVSDYLWTGSKFEYLGNNWGPGRCP
jgi:hypothetical protein